MNASIEYYTPSVSLYNVKGSQLKNGSLLFYGEFINNPSIIPVLLVSDTIPYAPETRMCTHNVCCLWDAAKYYNDAHWLRVLDPLCGRDQSKNTNNTNNRNTGIITQLAKGTVQSNTASSYSSTQLILDYKPALLRFVFIDLSPVFNIKYETVTFTWTQQVNSTLRMQWRGPQCVDVLFNEKMMCIWCMNTKPENSVFVYTAQWMTTYQCDWQCIPGHFLMGDSCTAENAILIPVVLGTGLIGVILLAALFYSRKLCRSKSLRSAAKDVASAPSGMDTEERTVDPLPTSYSHTNSDTQYPAAQYATKDAAMLNMSVHNRGVAPVMPTIVMPTPPRASDPIMLRDSFIRHHIKFH